MTVACFVVQSDIQLMEYTLHLSFIGTCVVKGGESNVSFGCITYVVSKRVLTHAVKYVVLSDSHIFMHACQATQIYHS
jgi:hypothetical protein